MLSRILGFGSVVTVAALMGCGGGGGGAGGTTFTTSVPAGTKLTALTPAQAMQLCNDFSAYGTKALAAENTGLCKLSGLLAAAFSGGTTDAGLQAACTQGYNSCLGADGGVTTTSSCDSTTFSGEPSTCQATVGDLQKCTSDETAATNQIYGSLPSCSTLTAATLASALSADAGAGPAEPASCAQFDATCDTTSMMTNGSPKRK